MGHHPRRVSVSERKRSVRLRKPWQLYSRACEERAPAKARRLRSTQLPSVRGAPALTGRGTNWRPGRASPLTTPPAFIHSLFEPLMKCLLQYGVLPLAGLINCRIWLLVRSGSDRAATAFEIGLELYTPVWTGPTRHRTTIIYGLSRHSGCRVIFY